MGCELASGCASENTNKYLLREKRRKPPALRGNPIGAKKIPHTAHWTACEISVTEEAAFPFVI
jgi:hypothetical protein